MTRAATKAVFFQARAPPARDGTHGDADSARPFSYLPGVYYTAGLAHLQAGQTQSHTTCGVSPASGRSSPAAGAGDPRRWLGRCAGSERHLAAACSQARCVRGCRCLRRWLCVVAWATPKERLAHSRSPTTVCWKNGWAGNSTGTDCQRPPHVSNKNSSLLMKRSRSSLQPR